MCKAILMEGNTNSSSCIGENAHIYGENPGSARYNPDLDLEYVNSYENLIYLCANCHKKIDDEEDKYPAEDLRNIKNEHEKWVLKNLEKGTISYTFAELEIIAKHLTKTNTPIKVQDYNIIKINEKINKNRLDNISGKIDLGLAKTNIVKEFINKYPDPDFSNVLTSIISEKYLDLKLEYEDPIAIFNDLWYFVAGESDDFEYKAAGLGILVYFFEKCEVFEK